MTRKVSHRGYEHQVASVLQSEGWRATVTPPVRDFGLDVIAERDGKRLGVQVKKYLDANRPVNPKTVMEAYGAAAYADCDRCIVVTDGRILPTAHQVATKLRIEIRHVPALRVESTPNREAQLDFDHVWTAHIAPLAGRILTRGNGRTNEIVNVGPRGVVRRTSNGKTQEISIDIFRWAIDRLLAGHTLSREDINDHYVARASSGIFLILSQVPLFDVITKDRKQAIRLRHDYPAAAGYQLARLITRPAR